MFTKQILGNKILKDIIKYPIKIYEKLLNTMWYMLKMSKTVLENAIKIQQTVMQ